MTVTVNCPVIDVQSTVLEAYAKYREIKAVEVQLEQLNRQKQQLAEEFELLSQTLVNAFPHVQPDTCYEFMPGVALRFMTTNLDYIVGISFHPVVVGLS